MSRLKTFLKWINSPYKDFWFRSLMAIFAGHLIVSHGYGFFKVMLWPGYLTSLIGSAIIAFILFMLVNMVCVQLDRSLPWDKWPIKRGLLQAGLGLLLIVVIAYLLADQLFIYMDQKIEESDYMTYDFYFVCLYIFLINTYYYVFFRLRKKEALKAELKKFKRYHRYYAFKNAEAHMKDIDLASFDIAPNELACAYWMNNSLYLLDMSGKLSISTETEEQVLANVPIEDFLRLSRFCIVHRLLVLNWREASSRRASIIFRAPFHTLIPNERKDTSQGLTAAFIKAFDNYEDSKGPQMPQKDLERPL